MNSGKTWYNKRRNLTSADLSEKAIWAVYGEDPNNYNGEPQPYPLLGYFEGTLNAAMAWGEKQDRFTTWGRGGYFEKVNPTGTVKINKAEKTTIPYASDLLAEMEAVKKKERERAEGVILQHVANEIERIKKEKIKLGEVVYEFNILIEPKDSKFVDRENIKRILRDLGYGVSITDNNIHLNIRNGLTPCNPKDWLPGK